MKLSVKEHGALIYERLNDGKSYRDIAAELGCHHTTVSIFVKVNFPDLRHKPSAHMEPPPMNILCIDIETRPNLAHVWRIWEENVGIDQIVSSTEMICFAAKWLDDPVVFFKSIHHHTKDEMLQLAWNLLDRADVVMHYNGRRFDVPHLNREFLEHGLKPPSPFKQIDLMTTVKHQFRFPSNKLAYVSQQLGLEGKVEHEGFRLWLKCLEGDNDAWERMYQYNVQDVQLVENLYYALLPWIERHPSYAAVTTENVCPNCGSEDLEQHGFAHTRTSKYVQYRCGNCGKFCRDTHRIDHTERTEVVS